MKTTYRAFAAVLAVAMATSLLLAQEEVAEEPGTDEGTFAESIDVNVVNVDVYVTDKKGNPIRGLKAEDFELYEDGKPVAITNFYEVAEGERQDLPAALRAREKPDKPRDPLAAPAVEEIDIPDEERLHLVIYVDNFNIRPFNRNRVFRQLRDFLSNELEQGDRVMLVSYDRSLHVRHQFTTDPQLIANATFELEKMTGHAVHLDSDRKDILRDIEEAEQVGEVDWRVRQFAESQVNDLSFTIDALREIVDSLGGLPGRRAILYVSDGLPMVPAEDLYYALNYKFRDSVSVTLSREFDASRRFIELSSRAATNQVVIYTIDAAGLRAPEMASVEYQTANTPGLTNLIDTVNISNIQAPLMLMAEETGGRAIYNTNDVGPALEKVASDFRFYYSLGYSPSHSGTGRLYKIKIKVKDRKGLDVRYRSNYRDKPLYARMADVVRSSLTYGFEENPMDLVVRFGDAAPGEKGIFTMPILVGIPLEKIVMVPQTEAYEGRVKLYFGAMDEGGDMSDVQEVDLPIRIPSEQMEEAVGKYFPFQTSLQIRSGGHRITVGIWDEMGAESSFVSKPVVIGSG